MRVILLAYREWATNALVKIAEHPKIRDFTHCASTVELLSLPLQDYDLLITLGWSEELGETVCSQIMAIGLHCAELDRYSYGSPIQNQIIDGLTTSKHRIFPFVWDSHSKRAHTHTREYSHETQISLHGSICDVFSQLTSTAIQLINMFLDDYPAISYKKWPEEDVVRSKRTPADSQLSLDQLRSMSTLDLYNFIRSLGDPYPNAFLEDEFGRLYFKKVSYQRK